MNLHAIVAGAIGTINPLTTGTVTPSTGYTTAGGGKRTPTYGTPFTVQMQVQALTTRDLMHLDSLNVQGSTHAIYMTGDLEAIERVSNRGGDLVQLSDGRTYLTTTLLERWPDWSKAAVTMQMDHS